MQNLTGVGAFTAQVRDQINQNFAQVSVGFPTGNIIWLDPFTGSDTYNGTTPTRAFKTLAAAYAAAREGMNDVVAVVSNGLTTSTVRLNTAFTWSKNATHLVGISSGVNISNRSRIAPSAGATAVANYFTVSGSGCLFQNIQFYSGFDTGTTSAICMTVTGGRNMFRDCHIAGMADTASAQSSTSRSLKISTTGENMFVDCVIGVDTVTSNTTNASLEFASATTRNQFIRCIFPRRTSSAGTLFITAAASNSMDRFQLFKECLFINAVASSGTAMTAAVTLGAATNGMLLLKDSTIVGCTDWGSDSTTFGQMYIDGAAPTNNTSGIAVVTA